MSPFFDELKLRDHRLMTRKSGIKSWPPLWVNSDGDPKYRPRGEVGRLQRVSAHSNVESKFTLWMEHHGSTYVGEMYFDDVTFCRMIRKVLESQIGVSIKEIGDLDLPGTF